MCPVTPQVKNQAQQQRLAGNYSVPVMASQQLPPGSLGGSALAAGGPADGEALVSTTSSLTIGECLIAIPRQVRA